MCCDGFGARVLCVACRFDFGFELGEGYFLRFQFVSRVVTLKAHYRTVAAKGRHEHQHAHRAPVLQNERPDHATSCSGSFDASGALLFGTKAKTPLAGATS